jgi:Nucleotide modification associated domain 2
MAGCKPDIRRTAKAGDYLVGTGSKSKGHEGQLVYWMAVDQIVDFDTYWNTPRFQRKRAVMNGSWMQRHGDNIYHRDGCGGWVQEDSFHSCEGGTLSAGNLGRDTRKTERVLLSRTFAYWGGDGPRIPDHLSDLVQTTQGHRCRFKPERVTAFVDWLGSMPERGFVGLPTDWRL